MAKFLDKVMIALILDEEEEELNRVERRKWVHEAWKERGSEWEFSTLCKELIDDKGMKFFWIFQKV